MLILAIGLGGIAPFVMLGIFLASYVVSFRYSERIAHNFIDSALRAKDWKASGYRSTKLLRQLWKLASALILPFIALIALPYFIGDQLGPGGTPRGRSASAKNAVATAAKECAVKEVKGESRPSFSVPQLKGYKITPQTGDCRGDKNGLITAVSEDKEQYPDFAVSLSTYSKSCSHNGPNEELHGCSARVNGTW